MICDIRYVEREILVQGLPTKIKVLQVKTVEERHTTSQRGIIGLPVVERVYSKWTDVRTEYGVEQNESN